MVLSACGLILRVKRKTKLELDHCTMKGSYTYTDSQDKSNLLNRHFSSVFTSEDTYLPTISEKEIPVIQPIAISVAGVINLLSNIKPFKATGPDKIPAY